MTDELNEKRLERRRELARGYAKARRARQRRILAWVKVTVGCADCGYAEHPDAIQMDHDVPVGSRDGHRSWSAQCKSFASFWRYLLDSNIVFRCANCHAIKSAEEQRDRPAVGLADGFREVA